MFLPDTQPIIRQADVFTRLPDRFRRDRPSTWSEANRHGVPAHSFLEGPVFDAQGMLYVTDIPWGRIFRVDPRGEWELVVEYDGEPNGMKFQDETTLVIADYKNGLMALDVRSREVSPFLERRNTERFLGVNDLVFDSRGNLYFTDQGQTGLHDPTGRVFRLGTDGRLDLLLRNVPSPNGLVLSPDEQVLYVAATRGNCVWRAPLMRDGSASKVGLFFTSNGPSGPDGLAMSEQGELLVANPGLGLVWVLDRLAQPIEVLRSPVGSTLTNIAFGGPARRTLYCTESDTGSILRVETGVTGAVLHPGRR
ncbi:SMP-30/gluconolactonase/LRE family protein [Variovorax sp. Root411]|uniref:SMP-30/gluconolactonase/LRE family protein n=1 Tax=Variovorax sp. Root411 TaxID=1736530 RepID=UPI0006F26EEF|nr:SMP-30/gluconolactonase/LRE family protein [Variovorax sp. Root411]KQW56427.1 gluconolactonase [Variovorax sp. Root411]